jgi:hypothetical protein
MSYFHRPFDTLPIFHHQLSAVLAVGFERAFSNILLTDAAADTAPVLHPNSFIGAIAPLGQREPNSGNR